ncbi:MAG: hypothetical protein ABIL15_07505, partial [candidate division WOR-3 bacterium]
TESSISYTVSLSVPFYKPRLSVNLSLFIFKKLIIIQIPATLHGGDRIMVRVEKINTYPLLSAKLPDMQKDLICLIM